MGGALTVVAMTLFLLTGTLLYLIKAHCFLSLYLFEFLLLGGLLRLQFLAIVTGLCVFCDVFLNTVCMLDVEA